jgi:hypothetical protein
VSPNNYFAPPYAISKTTGDTGSLPSEATAGIALGFDHYRSTPSTAVWSSMDPWQMEARFEKGNFDPLVFYQKYLRWLDPVGNSVLVAAADYENPQWESLWDLLDPDILEGDPGPLLSWSMQWYWNRETWLAENPGFLGRFIRPPYPRFPVESMMLQAGVRIFPGTTAGDESWVGDWYWRRTLDNPPPCYGLANEKGVAATDDARLSLLIEPYDGAHLVQVTALDNADEIFSWGALSVDLNDNVLLPQMAGATTSEFVLFRLLWPAEWR